MKRYVVEVDGCMLTIKVTVLSVVVRRFTMSELAPVFGVIQAGQLQVEDTNRKMI